MFEGKRIHLLTGVLISVLSVSLITQPTAMAGSKSNRPALRDRDEDKAPVGSCVCITKGDACTCSCYDERFCDNCCGVMPTASPELEEEKGTSRGRRGVIRYR